MNTFHEVEESYHHCLMSGNSIGATLYCPLQNCSVSIYFSRVLPTGNEVGVCVCVPHKIVVRTGKEKYEIQGEALS